jgi:hypothetical protein
VGKSVFISMTRLRASVFERDDTFGCEGEDGEEGTDGKERCFEQKEFSGALAA